MTSDLAPTVKASWRCFLEEYEPLRPELYRYARYLTRSPWDAEDLAQDTLARAFVALACADAPPANPRAWLFRVASNLWLNRAAKQREILGEAREPAVAAEPRAAREAAGTLLVRLSPQERAAVVLKDVFDLSLDEVADALATTPGAIKAALHRGRGKLSGPEPESPPTVVPAVLDAFCAAFNAGDLPRLTALLLDTATVEYPGLIVESGARGNTLAGTLHGCAHGEDAARGLVGPPRCEVRVHRGEPLLLWWWGAEVRGIVRATVADGRIAHLCNYFHAPEVLAELGAELGVPVRTNGYFPWRHA